MIESPKKKFNQSQNVNLDKRLFHEGIELFIGEDDRIINESQGEIAEEEGINSASSIDVPERILTKGMNGIEEEAEWLLLKIIKANPDSIIDEDGLKAKIIDLLKLNKEELIDVPYIATYKKHLYQPDLSFDQVYEMFSYEREYLELLKYKAHINSQYNAIDVYLKDYPKDFRGQYIDKAKSLNELDDIRAFIHYMKESHLSDKDNKPLQKIINSEVKSIVPSAISQLANNKLNEFVSSFALPMEVVASNLQLLVSEDHDKGMSDGDNDLQLSPEPHETPAILSSKYLNNYLNEELKVLTQGCKFLAIQLSSHPYIRQFVMDYYYKNAVISTQPTKSGKEMLTEDHPSFRVKYIKEKPILSFDASDLYLDIIANEKKELITVNIEIKDNAEEFNKLATTLLTALYPNKTSANEVLSKAWNVMREESLRMLIREVLFSSFKTKIRSELRRIGEDYVIKYISKEFSQMLLTSAYEHRGREYPVVFALTYEPNESKVYSVIVNANGDVAEAHSFHFISMKLIGLKKEEKAKYHQEISRCTSLIDTYQPEVIIIGANDLICRYLKDQLSALTPVPVEFSNVSIIKLFAESKYAKQVYDKSKFDEVYLQSIGLGKFTQSPLETLVSMWEESDHDLNACLKISFHPLQKSVNTLHLENAFKTELIKAVNIVGVDQSKQMNHLLKKKLLSLICGLSANANKTIEKLFEIKNREELKTQLSHLKKILFNCNGFIYFSSSKTILDRTRIPLDMYQITQKALGICLKKKINKDFSSLASIEDLKGKMESVDIDTFFQQNKTGITLSLEEGKSFLGLLVTEIPNPFKTNYIPYKSLSNKESTQLYISDPYFDNGIMTTAKIVRFEDTYIKCSLFNGLDASLFFEDTTDDAPNSQSVDELKQQFKDIVLLRARVKEINWETQTVSLTIKPSVLLNHKEYLTQIKDKEHFDFDNEDLKTVECINQSLLHSGEDKKLIARKIPNEKFKNFTLIQSTEFLSAKNIGEFVFRPSYLGEDYLTMTIKIEKSILIHYDIRQDKSSLQYHLLDNSYTDLKEIADKYILPCTSLYNSARNNRKYISMDNYIDFERKLKLEKKMTPTLIHYFFTILKEFPAHIILGYTPKMSLIHIEYVKVSPAGYEFHNQKFISIDDVIDYLKRHYGSDEYSEYLRRIKPPAVDYGRNCERDYKEIAGLDLVEGSFAFNSNRGIRNSTVTSCKYCKEEGHLIADCPKIKEKENKTGFTRNKRQRDDGGQEGRSFGWGSNNDSSNINNNENSGWGSEKNDNKMVIEESGWGNVKEKTNDAQGWESQLNQTNNDRNVIEVTDSNGGWGNTKDDNKTSTWATTKKEETIEQGWSSSTQQETQEGWGNSTKKEPVSKNEQGLGNSTKEEGWGNSTNQTTSTQQWGTNENDSTSNQWNNGNSNSNESKKQWNNNSKDNNSFTQQKPKFNNNQQGEGNQQWGNKPRVNNNSQWGNNNAQNASAWNSSKQESQWGQQNSNKNTDAWDNKKQESNDSGWGSVENKPIESSNTPSGWDNQQKESKDSGWGSTTTNKPIDNVTENSWGDKKQESTVSGWDSAMKNTTESNWGNSKQEKTEQGWGSTNTATDWGTSNNTQSNKVNNSNNNNNDWTNSGNSNWKNSNNTETSWGKSNNNNAWGSQSKGDSFKKPTRGCYNCGEEGHSSRDCTQPKKERPPLKCYNCGEDGHGSRNCTQPKKERPPMKCFNCNEEGHVSRDCPNPKKERSSKCFKCGEEGHSSRDCTQTKTDNRPPLKCYNCGEEGHGSRNCTQPKKERTNKCFNCNEEGHNSYECPQPKKERKKSCFNCGSEDHMSFKCPEPPKEGGNNRGRGRGGRGDDRGRGRGRGGYGNNNYSYSSSNRNSSEGWNLGNDQNNQWGTTVSNANDNWGSSSNTTDNDKGIQQTGWESSLTSNQIKTNNGEGWGNDETSKISQDPEQDWGNDNNKTSRDKDQGWGNDNTNKVSLNTDQGWGNANNDTEKGWEGTTKEKAFESDDSKIKSVKPNNESGWEKDNSNDDMFIPKASPNSNKNENWLSSTKSQAWLNKSALPNSNNNKQTDKAKEAESWGTTIYNPITKTTDQGGTPNSGSSNKGKETLEPGEFNPNL